MLFGLMDSFKHVPDGAAFNQHRQDFADMKAGLQSKKRAIIAEYAKDLEKKLEGAETLGESGKKVCGSCKKSAFCSRPNGHSGQCNKVLAK